LKANTGARFEAIGDVPDLNDDYPFSLARELSLMARTDEHWQDAVRAGHGLPALEGAAAALKGDAALVENVISTERR